MELSVSRRQFVGVFPALGTHLRAMQDSALPSDPIYRQLPIHARVGWLVQRNAAVRALPSADRVKLVLDHEAALAEAENRRPLIVRLWGRRYDGCEIIYDFGVEWQMFNIGPLQFGIAASRTKNHKVVGVRAHLDPQAKIKVDVLPENMRMASMEPDVIPLRQVRREEFLSGEGDRRQSAADAGLLGAILRSSPSREATELAKVASLVSQTLTAGVSTHGILYFQSHPAITSFCFEAVIGRTALTFVI